MTADQAEALRTLRHAKDYIYERWSEDYVQLGRGEYMSMYDTMQLLDLFYYAVQKEVL